MKLRKANAIKVKLQFNPEPPIKYQLQASLDLVVVAHRRRDPSLVVYLAKLQATGSCSANHRLACKNISGAQPL
jgi:hypothetical protein